MNELIVSERPKVQLVVVMDAMPFRASLPGKPVWLPNHEWYQLLVWVTMVTDRREPLETSWYKHIDYVYRAMMQSLERQRIINVDIALEARNALPKCYEVYRWIVPVLYPTLEALYPHIQQGYKIQFNRLDGPACYLTLTLN